MEVDFDVYLSDAASCTKNFYIIASDSFVRQRDGESMRERDFRFQSTIFFFFFF
jgi:hypothetical protein